MRKKGTTISDIERRVNDYIRYYDNLNKTQTQIIAKLKNKFETEIKDSSFDSTKYLNSIYIQKIINYETENSVDVTNLYIREKIKSMVESNEFKEMVSTKGPMKLIEYVKDIWLIWTDLIYESSNLNYFTSVGAENDFEWVKLNPFNEIKKYDIFY